MKLSYEFNTTSYIKINHQAYIITKNELDITLIQFFDKKGILIPRFCYHESSSVAGNCRMCLIEIVGSIKPIIACATLLGEGMEIITNSPLVKKARESVLEFLLINHPLDCPICDQAGECDLQDQTLLFGSDRGRFEEIKRSVSDKNISPFIKTVMTRCIHCTRCIRFMEEIAMEPIIGMFGRGKNSEISIYDNKLIKNNLSGNIIDLCPVGALTSKPYAFTARPWELNAVESIDIIDSLNSNILIFTKNNIIMRILPRINSEINEFWISDTIRFLYDGLNNSRLLYPMLKENDLFINCSWHIAIQLILIFFKKKIKFISGKNEDIETIYLLKMLSDGLGGIIDIEIETKKYKNNKSIFSFILSNTQTSLNNLYLINQLFLPEAIPVLWSTLIKTGSNNIIQIGNYINNLILHIGISNISLNLLLNGRSFFCKKFFDYVNIYLYTQKDISIYNKLINDVNVYLYSGEISFYYSGFNNEQINTQVYYLVNTFNVLESNNEKFSIFHGSHFSPDAIKSNILLPTACFVEDSLLYLNLQGYFQRTSKAINLIGVIKTNKDLLLLLFKELNLNNSFIIYFDFLIGKLFNINIKLINLNLILNQFHLEYSKEYYNILCLSSKHIMNNLKIKRNEHNFFSRNI